MMPIPKIMITEIIEEVIYIYKSYYEETITGISENF
jgi:hypothetical protein